MVGQGVGEGFLGKRNLHMCLTEQGQRLGRINLHGAFRKCYVCYCWSDGYMSDRKRVNVRQLNRGQVIGSFMFMLMR